MGMKLDDHGACRIIRRMIATTGVVPTHRQIAQETGLTPAGVQSLMERLLARGYIKKNPGEARAFTLTNIDLPADLRDESFMFIEGEEVREDQLKYKVLASIYDHLRRIPDPESPDTPVEKSELFKAKRSFRITIQRL